MNNNQKRTLRSVLPGGTRIRISDTEFGGANIILIAGPCAVEDGQGFLSTAQLLKASGAHILRGSLFKTRTAPYSFQGLGKQGIGILAETKKNVSMPIAQEVTSNKEIKMLSEVADLLFIGARNMQNVDLLRAVGKSKKPVILKRGMGCTINELLLAAEHIMNAGNPEVILCERGIRTFESSTRFTLDISAIPVLKRLSHLPVIVDPSHAAGDRELVPALSMAAVAAGADGLIIEVHPDPQNALSDAPQQISINAFSSLVCELQKVALAIGRRIT